MPIDRVSNGPRLAVITTGLAGGGIAFSFFLSGYVASRRPLSPDTVRGYTSLIHIKSAEVYGTQFEHFVATYGPLLLFMIVLFSGAFEFRFFYLEGRPRPLRLYFVAAALAMAALTGSWMLLP
jgi:hypothetical protein